MAEVAERPFLTRQEKDMAAMIAARLADLLIPALAAHFEAMQSTLAETLAEVRAARQDAASLDDAA